MAVAAEGGDAVERGGESRGQGAGAGQEGETEPSVGRAGAREGGAVEREKQRRKRKVQDQ